MKLTLEMNTNQRWRNRENVIIKTTKYAARNVMSNNISAVCRERKQVHEYHNESILNCLSFSWFCHVPQWWSVVPVALRDVPVGQAVHSQLRRSRVRLPLDWSMCAPRSDAGAMAECNPQELDSVTSTPSSTSSASFPSMTTAHILAIYWSPTLIWCIKSLLCNCD